jgi:hypothetical protein
MKRLIGTFLVLAALGAAGWYGYKAYVATQPPVVMQTPTRDGYAVAPSGQERTYAALLPAREDADDAALGTSTLSVTFQDGGLGITQEPTRPGEVLALTLRPGTSKDFLAIIAFDVPNTDFEAAFEAADATCIERDVEAIAGYEARKRSCQTQGIVADSYLIDLGEGRYVTVTAQYDRSIELGVKPVPPEYSFDGDKLSVEAVESVIASMKIEVRE